MNDVTAFLKIGFERNPSGYVLTQRRYVQKILDTFNMLTAKPVATPMDPAAYRNFTLRQPRTSNEATEMNGVPYAKLIGQLLYLSTHTRPEITFATSILAGHMSTPRPVHWNEAKRVLSYLRGIAYFALHLCASDEELTAFADADWAGSADRLSVTGNMVLLGGAPVTRRSSEQQCTVLPSPEAEYVSLSTVARDVLCLRRLCTELGMPQAKATSIGEDNTDAIAWESDIANFRRNKHVDVRTHFVREFVDRQEVCIEHAISADQSADTLTKPHAILSFVSGRDKLFVRANSDSNVCASPRSEGVLSDITKRHTQGAPQLASGHAH